jgi:hypothetical protein
VEIADIFRQINIILERESKTATYKFALLRCTIEVIQEKSPFILVNNDEVKIPLYLLIGKWILAYYPIFESGYQYSQINGESVRLAFQKEMSKVLEYYKCHGGISVLNRDLKTGFPDDIVLDSYFLIKQLRNVITKNPMRYIGSKLFGKHYSLFTLNDDNKRFADLSNPIRDLGTFSIPKDYYDVFYLLGSFITGQDSILSKWAEFSTRSSNDSINKNIFVEKLLEMPVVKRDQATVSKYFSDLLKDGKKVYCVWTGREILSKLHAEHIFPFSLWKNNDLWNLLPSLPSVNSNKSDKIPSSKLILRQKDYIRKGWELYLPEKISRFKIEFEQSLIGKINSEIDFDKGINALQEISDYLIDVRGYEAWNG